MGDLVVEVTDENFEDETVAGSNLVVVDFVSEWAPDCKRVSEIVEHIGRKYADRVRVRRVDIDRNAETAVKYGVLAAPTVLFFNNGEEVGRVAGIVTKTRLFEEIESLLKKLPPPRKRPEPTLQPE